MKVIGITGGVGSGKSTITKLLKEHYHAFLINTDQIAHMLMQKDMISYNLIIAYFGESILNQEREINRSLLGKLVYEDAFKLTQLNSFTHPYVKDYVIKLIQCKREEKLELICVETALPVEAGLKEFCDQIWYVYTPEEVRRVRLKEDRNYTEEKFGNIVKRQLSDEEYRKISTYVLNNNCEIEKIIEQIEVLLVK